MQMAATQAQIIINQLSSLKGEELLPESNSYTSQFSAENLLPTLIITLQDMFSKCTNLVKMFFFI